MHHCAGPVGAGAAGGQPSAAGADRAYAGTAVTALAGARRFLRDAPAQDIAEWFERRYDDSGGTDVEAYEAAAEFRSHPDPADRPYAAPVHWAGFVYTGP
ncbi:MAG TPA: hypothetical protein VJ370_11900 [Streptosporangiaceae bacterium]|nr:hypothetical protein [Streptosporangiaceae bacterium]